MEERLRFYEDGVAPGKNITAMQAAMAKLRDELGDAGDDEGMEVDGGSAKKKEKKDKVGLAGRRGGRGFVPWW